MLSPRQNQAGLDPEPCPELESPPVMAVGASSSSFGAEAK